MPRVALPASIKPPNHSLAARSRAAAADSERSDTFAALLEGPNDRSPPNPARANRAANAAGAAATRPSDRTPEEGASVPTPEADSVEQAETPAAPQSIVPVDRTAIAPAVEATAEPRPDGAIADVATVEVAEAVLPPESADQSARTSPDAAGQPPTPAGLDKGLDIGPVVAAAPAQDAIAVAGDRVASGSGQPALPGIPRRATEITRDPVAGAPATNAQEAAEEQAAPPAAAPAVQLAENPDAKPISGRADGAHPRHAALEAHTVDAGSEPDVRQSGESRPEGKADVVGQQSRPEQADSHPTRGREPTAPASDGATTPAANDTRSGDLSPTARTPADVFHLGTAPHALDRPSASNVAHAATAAHPSTAAAVPIEGLAVEIAAHSQAGRNRFEIRLDPPELGRIDVRLDVDRGGHVTSRLVVERAETLELLRRDAHELERALQQAGLKTSEHGLEFSLRGESFAGRDDGRAAQDTARLTVSDAEAEPVAATPSAYARSWRAGGGIDIRI